MNIALGADHAGFELKEVLKPFLESLGHEVEDVGAHTLDEGDDYPDFVFPAARSVVEGKADRAIVLGGSGQGEAMAANRLKGVRAAVFYGGNREIVRLSRKHNEANVLSIGARFVGEGEIEEVVGLWLETPFLGEERHRRRIKKLDARR